MDPHDNISVIFPVITLAVPRQSGTAQAPTMTSSKLDAIYVSSDEHSVTSILLAAMAHEFKVLLREG